jgi:hypothetical protein
MPAYRMKTFARIVRWRTRLEVHAPRSEMIFAADAGEAHRVAAARRPDRVVQVERVPCFGLDEYRRERRP